MAWVVVTHGVLGAVAPPAVVVGGVVVRRSWRRGWEVGIMAPRPVSNPGGKPTQPSRLVRGVRCRWASVSVKPGGYIDVTRVTGLVSGAVGSKRVSNSEGH